MIIAKSFILDVRQYSEFASLVNKNLRKNPRLRCLAGFEFAFAVIITTFAKRFILDVFQSTEYASAIFTAISIRRLPVRSAVY